MDDLTTVRARLEDTRCDVQMEQDGCRCRGCMRWRMETVPALLAAYDEMVLEVMRLRAELEKRAPC